MLGLMQDWPLTLDKIISNAGAAYGRAEIFYRDAQRRIQVTNYSAILESSRRFSASLIDNRIALGDRVATLMWNNPEHMIAWYGTMSIGAVLHTLNPRLGADRLAWLIGKSRPRILVVEKQFEELISSLADKIDSVELVVVAGDTPPGKIGEIATLSFDSFLDSATDHETLVWGGFDENTAAGLCFTSGTTGDPKGVLYSHRSNFLHGMMINQASSFALTADDVVLPIVPMFHANAWALTFSAPMAGASMALPGSFLDGPSVSELINYAKVTFTAGVPTVFSDLLRYLRSDTVEMPTLQRMVVGGSAVTSEIVDGFAKERGIELIHGWGMTEMSPLGSVSRIRRGDPDDFSRLMRQGQAVYPVEAVILDAEGKRCPHDNKSSGFLHVSGPTVVKRYYGESTDTVNARGYFDTGDIAVIDETGSILIVDRAKDVIKSGGEWISSIELEDAALSHRAVMRAAVIAVPHPRWTERPLLVVEIVEGESFDVSDILQHVAKRVPKWWVPDHALVRPIPLGATGKIEKVRLRAQLAEEKSSLLTSAA